jgi:cell division transport system permease protein
VRALAYFLDEAALSLWRRRGATLLAVATIAISFFVLGLFLLASANASRLLERWSAAAEFSVYLRDGVNPADRAAIERTLTGSGVVAQNEYVSRDEALRRFGRQFPDLAASARSLPANPLPASYEVRLRPEMARDQAIDRLAERVRALNGVADVRYDRRWIDRLLGIVQTLRMAGLTLAMLLVIASCVTVMSVVRLTLYARRQEIEIMQLVGAPLAYIRGPFVVEGTLQGVFGASVALVFLWVVYAGGRGRAVAWASGVVDAGDLVFLPLGLAAAVVLGGAAVGCVGGMLAARATRSI